ncbi:MAG: hypothetical protein M3179_01670, partial [Actinomycetota bacterium]|nr:hypothetical protein [Actinomycetota bacterium]
AGGGGGGGAETVTVDVDGNTSAYNGSFIAYFPSEVTVRQGDTVEFKSIWRGEPHTVTMGTLVDRGLAAADQNPDARDEPPDLAKVPALLTEPPEVSVNQSAGQRCFLTTGDPPPSEACTETQQEQPDFDGAQTYYNSGFLADGDVFKVKLADDIAPGTYRYFCNLHRASQQGRITVVGAEGQRQTASQVKEAGEAQLNDMVAKVAPNAEALKTGTLPPIVPAPEPGTVISGSGSPEVPEALVNEFGPKDFSIPVGGTVTWKDVGPHTVSFNSPVGPNDWITKMSDGMVQMKPEAFAPAGGPPVTPPEPGTPPDPANLWKITDGGSWDGTGSRSTGIIPSFPPTLLGYKLTFTRAGTFNYICIFHPGMTGSIKVG